MTASEIEALGGYYGATPKPADFEAFWQARMAEADAVPLDYTVTQAKEVPSWDGCDFLDLWFTGMAGARIYAKYLRPHSDKPVPLVLQFHGYPGASRSFAEQASFAGMGMALIAMDCPGQAGYSVDAGGFLGTTVSGHIIAGLDGPPERMYYVRLHQNIRILCHMVPFQNSHDLIAADLHVGKQHMEDLILGVGRQRGATVESPGHRVCSFLRCARCSTSALSSAGASLGKT